MMSNTYQNQMDAEAALLPARLAVDLKAALARLDKLEERVKQLEPLTAYAIHVGRKPDTRTTPHV